MATIYGTTLYFYDSSNNSLVRDHTFDRREQIPDLQIGDFYHAGDTLYTVLNKKILYSYSDDRLYIKYLVQEIPNASIDYSKF